MKTMTAMVVTLALLAPSMVQADSSQATAARLAKLVAHSQPARVACHINQALDRGTKPGEISEMIVDLAFHAGWERAETAAIIAQEVFAERRIDAGELAQTRLDLLLIGDEIAIAEPTIPESQGLNF